MGARISTAYRAWNSLLTSLVLHFCGLLFGYHPTAEAIYIKTLKTTLHTATIQIPDNIHFIKMPALVKALLQRSAGVILHGVKTGCANPVCAQLMRLYRKVGFR